jgi:hypothetical protein
LLRNFHHADEIMLKETTRANIWGKRPTAIAHTCNPNYFGGRGWEDRGLRPAQAKR